MSLDSQELLAQLEDVEQINQSNPDFYNKEQEITKMRYEFGKKWLKKFAGEIKKNMQQISFNVVFTRIVRFISSPAFLNCMLKIWMILWGNIVGL